MIVCCAASQHLRGYGADDNRLARELFEQAVALDPRYALAHAYLALSLLVEHRYGAASDAIKQRALDIATAAVRLDPLEGRCHTFLGQVYRFRDEYDLAITHLERGVELNPNDAIGLLHLGAVLGVSGRAEEGIEIVHRAIRLDPYLNFFWGTLALCLYVLRRYEEALAASRKAGAGKSSWHDGARSGLSGAAWTSRRSPRAGRRSAPPQAGFQREGGDAALQIFRLTRSTCARAC